MQAESGGGGAPEACFHAVRPRLIRLAYRMLGSIADAEDVVHEAYARWLEAERAQVREPAAFLRTIVVRLCLNELKSARRRRETYIGPWLPEPLFDPEDGDSVDDVTLPLMLALERLSPLERAAFLLHDIFGMAYADVARAIGRDEANCRKLASRARARVQEARPRFAVAKDHGLKIAAAFYSASRSGDMRALELLLAEDVIASADGGGKVPATPVTLVGRETVLSRHQEMARDFARCPSCLVQYAMIDGLPGFVTIEAGSIVQTTALQVEDGGIRAIYVTRNPDKLRRVIPGTPH